MTHFVKHIGVLLLTLALVWSCAVGACAASAPTSTPELDVGVHFYNEKSDADSMANSGIDPERTATLTRQTNGTYTLALPIQQVSKMGITGQLSGLTIGDVTYAGELTGTVSDGTAVLTIKNLPASVLTGSDVNNALTVICNIQMDLSLLGEINTTARLCIWNNG